MTTPEQNRETIRRWVEEMWNAGDRGCARSSSPPASEHAHAPFSESEPGEVDGPMTMRASMDWLLGQFPGPADEHPGARGGR